MVVQIENRNKFDIGDKVWYFDAWDNLCHGVIYKIKDGHALIDENGALAGSKLEKCWPSKQECLDAEKRRARAQLAEYKASIESVEDLVRFLYTHNIHSECPDYEAKQAAEERAKELGIDLEQEQ